MSHEQEYIDYYEVLQLSQNADSEMVERVYRVLAKRYHPDNADTGNDERFREVHDAYDVLRDPRRRAAFDVRYDEDKSLRWRIFEPGSVQETQGQDQAVIHGLLMLLYAARRQNPQAGGLGPIHIEEMLGVPREHLEFPVWYLRRKGLIETLQSGALAITVEGIDSLIEDDDPISDSRFLQPASTPGRGPGDFAAAG